ARRFRPGLEELEARVVPSSADGNGPVVTGLSATPNSTALVVTFDGGLNLAAGAMSAQNLAFFRVNQLVPAVNPELITTSGAAVAVLSGTYNAGTSAERRQWRRRYDADRFRRCRSPQQWLGLRRLDNDPGRDGVRTQRGHQ